MSKLLILGATNGLIGCEWNDDGWRVSRQGQSGLIGLRVTSAAARDGVMLAGTRDGIFRSDDLGLTWRDVSQGLTTRYVRWLAIHPDNNNIVLAGTEPAGIYISKDGGLSWRTCPEVAMLRDQRGWSLPYSPEAGCVRGFAFHGQRVYAAVEVGGVLVSEDSGESWRLADGSQEVTFYPPKGAIHPDVHSIEVHPSSRNIVYAPTGGGFFRSGDGGTTWTLRYRCYCRAVWVDPNDPEHILLGVADGVDANGRIERSRDGGLTWQPASHGLEVPWRRHMVERFTQVGDELLAVLSSGDLIAAPLGTLEWRYIMPDIRGVNVVTWLTL